jgi:hypothetical protein
MPALPYLNRIGSKPVRARIAWAPFSLVVFDKGGTLIDFRAMWCGWATDLAQR